MIGNCEGILGLGRVWVRAVQANTLAGRATSPLPGCAVDVASKHSSYWPLAVRASCELYQPYIVLVSEHARPQRIRLSRHPGRPEYTRRGREKEDDIRAAGDRCTAVSGPRSHEPPPLHRCSSPDCRRWPLRLLPAGQPWLGARAARRSPARHAQLLRPASGGKASGAPAMLLKALIRCPGPGAHYG